MNRDLNNKEIPMVGKSTTLVIPVVRNDVLYPLDAPIYGPDNQGSEMQVISVVNLRKSGKRNSQNPRKKKQYKNQH